jgi:serine/threonine protein kinase
LHALQIMPACAYLLLACFTCCWHLNVHTLPVRRQYMAGGDLEAALACDIAEHGAANRRLGWYMHGHNVMLCVACALDYLHDLQPAVRAAGRMRPACAACGVAMAQACLVIKCVGPGAQLVHLDIKSANVLLQDATFEVAKLADLGVSKYLDHGDQYRKSWRPGAHFLCQLHSLGCLPGCSYIVNRRRSGVSLRSGAVPVRDAYETDTVTADRLCTLKPHPNEKAHQVRLAL